MNPRNTSGPSSLDHIKDETDSKSSNLLSPRRAFSEAWGASDFKFGGLDSEDKSNKKVEERKEFISNLKLDTSSNPLKTFLNGSLI